VSGGLVTALCAAQFARHVLRHRRRHPRRGFDCTPAGTSGATRKGDQKSPAMRSQA
jgi:hypothetical protein